MPRVLPCLQTALLIAFGLGVRPAAVVSASTICAVASADGTGCSITVTNGQPIEVYIVATLSGDAAVDCIRGTLFSLPALADLQTNVEVVPNPGWTSSSETCSSVVSPSPSRHARQAPGARRGCCCSV